MADGRIDDRPAAYDPAVTTYRFLRIGLVLVLVLLAVAVGVQIAHDSARCLLPSISAYYYTPARNVFVAALVALGFGTVVVRGNTVIEDVLLTITGATVAVVAFVPVPIGQATGRDGCPTNPVPADLAASVSDNGLALLVTGVAALLVGTVVVIAADGAAARAGRPVPRRAVLPSDRRARLLAVTGAVVVAGFGVWFLAARASFLGRAHDVAALLTFAGIVGVVFANAVDYARRADVDDTDDVPAGRARGVRRRLANWYTALAVALLLTLLVLGGLGAVHHVRHELFRTWVFWAESAVIVEFAVFWLLQTVELWDDGRGRARPGPARRRLLLPAAASPLKGKMDR